MLLSKSLNSTGKNETWLTFSWIQPANISADVLAEGGTRGLARIEEEEQKLTDAEMMEDDSEVF